MRLKPFSRLLGLSFIAALIFSACNANSNTASGPTPANQAPAGAVHVKFIYSSEKQQWVEAVTADFNSAGNKTKSGKPIFIDTEAVGSGESVTNIVNEVA